MPAQIFTVSVQQKLQKFFDENFVISVEIGRKMLYNERT